MLPKYQTEIPGHFKELLNDLNRSLNGEKQKPFHQLRLKGGQKLIQSGFPTTRNEDYKYTALNRVFNKEYVLPHTLPITSKDLDSAKAMYREDLGGDYLCFINGIYHAEHSSLTQEGVSVRVIGQMNDHDPLQNEAIAHWDEILSESDNPFLQLNAGLTGNGLLIEVEKNSQHQHPLQLLFYYTAIDQAIIANPQILVIARENSNLKIIEQHQSSPANEREIVFANNAHRIILEKYAILSHFKVQETALEDFFIHNMIVNQKRNSHFFSLTADLGGRMVRNNLEVHLKESYTNTDMYGLFIGRESQHIDNQTFLDHAIPHSESREWYKGVLSGKSRGVFNGKVLVRQDAQKTNAFQQNNTLLVSENARMDSKPQLEIYADDVKCSHGATIGYMEEDILFYLMSRGLNKKQAGELVKIAFLAEVFDSVDREEIKNFLTGKVLDQLQKF